MPNCNWKYVKWTKKNVWNRLGFGNVSYKIESLYFLEKHTLDSSHLENYFMGPIQKQLHLKNPFGKMSIENQTKIYIFLQ